ncbi:MAG TPA: FAD-dependent oxidoreductase [Nanoarchaeota archaeon]|nr:FAD-dependent oxidoreductase [Nanoarchaeota archaeon]
MPKNPPEKSVAVIGGGIIGSSIARELALEGHEVAVLEKESTLGFHQSGRNSGVLHSGTVQAYLSDEMASLKVQMCIEGNDKAKKFCKDHGVAVQECGTLYIARKGEGEKLEEMLASGNWQGIGGLRILSNSELAKAEPRIGNGLDETALLAPSGAIVDSIGFLKAVARDAESLGVKYVFDFPVTQVQRVDDKILSLHSGIGHELFVSHVVNAAGLYADKIAHQMDLDLEYTIIPFRGEYREVDGLEIKSMIYHIPDKRFPFLGVHLTPTIDGIVIAGPTSALAFGRESYDGEFNKEETREMLSTRNFWHMALSPKTIALYLRNRKISKSEKAFLGEVQEIAPSVTMQDLSSHPAGIRAQVVDRKGKMHNAFIVDFQKDSTHVLNAVSPGMTCALPFAEYVVRGIKFYEREGRAPTKNELMEKMYSPVRPAPSPEP